MMRLGWPSYLMHGTNKPPAVGMRASAGCVRLYPEDIALIFEAVPDGTKVTVVNQPFVLGWRGDSLLRAGLRAARGRQAQLGRRAEGAAPEAEEAESRRCGSGSPSTTRRSTGRRSRAAAATPRGIALDVGPGPCRDIDGDGRRGAARAQRPARRARPGTASRTSTPATRSSRSPPRRKPRRRGPATEAAHSARARRSSSPRPPAARRRSRARSAPRPARARDRSAPRPTSRRS